jgi:hypothetical protein
LPTKFDILQSYNAELYQSLKLGRFGQRQMGSSADDDDDDNRDYEGEHMRLVKNTHTFCTGTKRALYTGYDG